MPEQKHLDWMSIRIEKDKEKNEYADYVFICTVYNKDPRYKNRNMVVGENRGLFRVSKVTLEPELLLPMEGDSDQKRYFRAAAKIIKEHKEKNVFPERAHFACG